MASCLIRCARPGLQLWQRFFRRCLQRWCCSAFFLSCTEMDDAFEMGMSFHSLGVTRAAHGKPAQHSPPHFQTELGNFTARQPAVSHADRPINCLLNAILEQLSRDPVAALLQQLLVPACARACHGVAEEQISIDCMAKVSRPQAEYLHPLHASCSAGAHALAKR